MDKKIISVIFAILLFSGCATVPMESAEKSELAKAYNPPSPGKSGLYIYRSGSFGGALKKDVWINGECIGETAPNMFFYKEVEGNQDYQISTESEFSPNDLLVNAKIGMHYFIRQYIKMGLFVGGAGLELVDEDKGKEEVQELNLAKLGTCS